MSGMRASTCHSCGEGLISERVWKAITEAERKAHRTSGRACSGARGLCKRCHERIGRNGDLDDYERLCVPRDLVVEEYEHACDHHPGESRKSRIRRLAPRLGMTPEAMERALLRAQKRQGQESAA